VRFKLKKFFLVTGGAGFIGSNLVRRLLKNEENYVYVFDNFSSGLISNLPTENSRLKIHKVDLKNCFKNWPQINEINTLFHLAANADVRGGEKDRNIDLDENVLVTKSICDYASKNNIDKVAFSSSATVYGEPNVFPTPESYCGPQTSVYGASKLSGEAYLQAYAEYGDFKLTIFRFVSWVGHSYSHGVIYDFVRKLKNNPKKLLILGDGTQKKSYLDVQDGVEGLFKLSELNIQKCNIFNLGHQQIIDVNSLADIVCKRMNLTGVEYTYTGGNKGWTGDSPIVHLDINKAKEFGWIPLIDIKSAIGNTVEYLMSNEKNLFR